MAVVYRHRRLDTFEVFYIGVGTINRPYSKRSRNKRWIEITESTPYEIEIVAELDNREDAFELEEFLIQEYGREKDNSGILCNHSKGGDLFMDNDPNQVTSIKVVIDGVEYPSLREASRVLGFHRDKIKNLAFGNSYTKRPYKNKAKDTNRTKSKGMIGENNPMYGKTGSLNPFYGKTHTAEFLRHKQLLHSSAVEVYNLLGELVNSFECTTDAGLYFGCTSANILFRDGKGFAKFGKFKELTIKLIK